MSIFDRRVSFKPFEYPHLNGYKDAIQHSFWTKDHWNFLGDIQDWHTNLTPAERSAAERAILAIAQVEVSVKRFWAKIGERFPKAEIEQVGAVFAESEVRHADAYSHLLEKMGLNDAFDGLLEVPAIKGRVDYLSDFMAGSALGTNENYTLCLTLFSLFIENVSLFAQFLVMKSFYKNRQVLKDVDNVVSATMKEETIHALFGAELVRIVGEEHPGSLGEAWKARVMYSAEKAFKAECAIVDWIFEAGELPYLNKQAVRAFVAHRLNESLKMLGLAPAFAVHSPSLETLRWFEEEIHAQVSTDFFHQRPVDYSLNDKPVTAGDLWDD